MALSRKYVFLCFAVWLKPCYVKHAYDRERMMISTKPSCGPVLHCVPAVMFLPGLFLCTRRMHTSLFVRRFMTFVYFDDKI
jgi:hypothetical protein